MNKFNFRINLFLLMYYYFNGTRYGLKGGVIAYIKLDANDNGNKWPVSLFGGNSSELLEFRPNFNASNNLWPAW